MITSRTEEIRIPDGGEFPGYLALPESGAGPGLVVIQEIFGVNGYIKDACERLAKLVYVVLAPDLYWRFGSGIAIDEKESGGLQRAFGIVGRLDFAKAGDDAIAALEHLRGLPEVTRRQAGILGFCLGGGIAYMVAALSGPVTCVSYYGSALLQGYPLLGFLQGAQSNWLLVSLVLYVGSRRLSPPYSCLQGGLSTPRSRRPERPGG